MDSLDQLLEEIVAFRDERDWAQFHTPDQLASALSIEVAELLELFLWKDREECAKLIVSEEGRERLEEEVADVLIFALLLCHEAELQPAKAVRTKLEKNRQKYPQHLSKGRPDKYTDLDSAED